MSGQFPTEILLLSNLQELYVGGNNFTGTMPRHSALLTDTPSGTIFTRSWVPIEVAVAVSLCLIFLYLGVYAVVRRFRIEVQPPQEMGIEIISQTMFTVQAVADVEEKNRFPYFVGRFDSLTSMSSPHPYSMSSGNSQQTDKPECFHYI